MAIGTYRIVVYDSETGYPIYTVDPPFPRETEEFYENLDDTDSTIGIVKLNKSATLVNRYVSSPVNHNIIAIALTTRPTMSISTSVSYDENDNYPIITQSGDPPQNKTVYTFTGVPVDSQIWVDMTNEYTNGSDTSFEMLFDSPGIYKIKIIKAPYQDYDLEVTIT
jgi:hypothetical protein